MKYRINTKRMLGVLAGVMVYIAVCLYAATELEDNRMAQALAILLSIAALNAVATLFVIFQPFERKDPNEEAQTVSCGGDSHSDCCHP